jgi:hypothetical protein
MNPYVNELIASRKCEGDDRRVVCIGDSGQKGTDVYWCQPAGRWICVGLDALPQIATAEEVALIRLHEDVDAEEGLNLRALASDCEREAGKEPFLGLGDEPPSVPRILSAQESMDPCRARNRIISDRSLPEPEGPPRARFVG